MFDNSLLKWVQLIASFVIIVPLILVIIRWKTHDLVRRRVAWYVIFNISFTLITNLLSEYFIDINNIFLYYLASPIFVWIVYRIFEPLVGKYKTYQIIKWIVSLYAIFTIIDMFWIENYKEFPNNIYPIQSIIIIFIIYYYLYIFSKEARKDFSSLWIGIGIVISAMATLIIIVYFPYLGFQKNTFGDFIFMGFGSIATILTYSFVSYGLWIARSRKI